MAVASPQMGRKSVGEPLGVIFPPPCPIFSPWLVMERRDFPLSGKRMLCPQLQEERLLRPFPGLSGHGQNSWLVLLEEGVQ